MKDRKKLREQIPKIPTKKKLRTANKKLFETLLDKAIQKVKKHK